MRRALAPLVAAALLALPAPALAFSYYPPGPEGPVFTSRPHIGAAVVLTPGDRLSASLALNGRIYPVTHTGGGFYFVPPHPLPPGPYTGTLALAGTDAAGRRYPQIRLPIRFTVSPAASTGVPGVSLASFQALAALNAVRASVGLRPVAVSPALHMAAADHALYVVANPDLYAGGAASAHQEPDPSRLAFTGTWPWDRDAAFGVTAATGEVLELAGPGLTAPAAVNDLLDTIWHRLSLLGAAVTSAGAGLRNGGAQSAFTLDFRFAAQPPDPTPAATLYPAPGQQGVPTTFWGETPNPLAGRTRARTAGYPVTLTWTAPDVQAVVVTAASLRVGPVPVPVFEYDSTSWHDTNPLYPGVTMGNSVALLAQRPLAPATTYTADIAGTLDLAGGRSAPFQRIWSFTTGPAPRAWRQGGRLFVRGVAPEALTVGPAGGAVSALPGAAQAGDLVVVPDSGARLAVAAGGAALPQSAPPFADLGTVPWAARGIYAAWALGWMKPFVPGAFAPGAPVTQEQALTLVYRAVGSPWADIRRAPAGAPDAARAAEAWAVAAGVIRPGEPLAQSAPASRAQFTAWVVRALAPGQSDVAIFTDGAAIPPAYAGAVGWAEGQGLVLGLGQDTFEPQAPVTRAEAAVLLARAFAAL